MMPPASNKTQCRCPPGDLHYMSVTHCNTLAVNQSVDPALTLPLTVESGLHMHRDIQPYTNYKQRRIRLLINHHTDAMKHVLKPARGHQAASE